MASEVFEKHFEDIEKKIERTVKEMGEIRKKINDNNYILENQKNLKKQYDAINIELNQLKHTAHT